MQEEPHIQKAWQLCVLSPYLALCISKEVQANKRKAKYSFPWLSLSIIDKLKVKDKTVSDLDAKPNADFRESELGLLASKLLPPPQGKNCAGTTESPFKTSGHQEGSQRGGRAKPRNYRNQGVQCEGIVSFCGSVSSAS